MVFILKPTGIKSFFTKYVLLHLDKKNGKYDFKWKTLCFFSNIL